MKPNNEPLLTPVSVRNGWLRTRDGKAALPLGEMIKGEDNASILYRIKPDEAAMLIVSASKRENFLISVAPTGSNFERVYSGPLQVSERDGDELARCMAEVLR